ncbi:MAG: PKD domain-containing protein, partial [Halobaculum sp.]
GTHEASVGLTAGFNDDNGPPRADAGLDQTVPVGTTVYLDGSGSLDPDGSITGYEWRITTPTGNSVAPVDATAARTRFTPTDRGQYRVTLVVTDDDGATRRDTAYVTVVARETATPVSTTTATQTVGRTPTGGQSPTARDQTPIVGEQTQTATPAWGTTPTEQQPPTDTPNPPRLTDTPTPASTATPTPDPLDSTLPYPGSGSSLTPIGGLVPDGSGGAVVPGPGHDDDSNG